MQKTATPHLTDEDREIIRRLSDEVKRQQEEFAAQMERPTKSFLVQYSVADGPPFFAEIVKAANEEELKAAEAKLGAVSNTPVPMSAQARRTRGSRQRAAVISDKLRKRDSDRSETMFGFRCSESLKKRLQEHKDRVRAGGESFNAWLEEVLSAAIDEYEKGSR